MKLLGLNQPKQQLLKLLIGLGFAIPVIVGLGLLSGSVDLNWQKLFSGQASAVERAILFDIRIPRVVSAFAVGGLLAMAGLLMQALLKNPLADPYILGVSGGAGLGGVLAALLAPAFAVAYLMPLGAGLGALGVVALVFGFSASRGFYTLERLILLGVAVSSICSALVSLMLTFSEEGMFRGLVFWLLGELSGQNYAWLSVAWGIGLLLSLPLARAMNVLILGEDLAQSVGVPVHSLRWALYWLAALTTGVAVAAGGMIGFVGLVVPHMMRLLIGSDHRLLVPACAIGGGLFLVAADVLARTVLAPVQLPVGVITALVGAPVFIFLLARQGVSRSRSGL